MTTTVDQLSLGDSASDLLVRVVTSGTFDLSILLTLVSFITIPTKSGVITVDEPVVSASTDSKAPASTSVSATAKKKQKKSVKAHDELPTKSITAVVEDQSASILLSFALPPQTAAKSGTKSRTSAYNTIAAKYTKLLTAGNIVRVSGSVAAAHDGRLQFRIDSSEDGGNGGQLERSSLDEWNATAGAVLAHPVLVGNPVLPTQLSTLTPELKQTIREAATAHAASLKVSPHAAASAQTGTGTGTGAEATAPIERLKAPAFEYAVSHTIRRYGAILIRKKPAQSFLEFGLCSANDPGTAYTLHVLYCAVLRCVLCCVSLTRSQYVLCQ
jgi:hypothetical protein